MSDINWKPYPWPFLSHRCVIRWTVEAFVVAERCPNECVSSHLGFVWHQRYRNAEWGAVRFSCTSHTAAPGELWWSNERSLIKWALTHQMSAHSSNERAKRDFLNERFEPSRQLGFRDNPTFDRPCWDLRVKSSYTKFVLHQGGKALPKTLPLELIPPSLRTSTARPAVPSPVLPPRGGPTGKTKSELVFSQNIL